MAKTIDIEELDNIIMSGVKSAISKASDQIGVLLVSQARTMCPYRTGRLRNSIDYDVSHGESEEIVTVGTNVIYAPFVEYGTGSAGDPAVPHTTKEKWVYKDELGRFRTARPHAAQPYLRPALNNSEQAIKDIVAGNLQEAFKL